MTTPARRLALEVFDCVLSQRRFLDEALQRRGDQFLALERRDRGFARLLLLTAFRRLGEIDAVLAPRLERPLPEAASIVRQILRLAVAELQFLGAPPHAAIDSAVEAAKQREPRFSGLVNAVLRGLTREGWPEPSDAISDEAVRANTPEWLWSRLVEDYGQADAALIAAGQLRAAPLDLTAKTPEAAAMAAERLEGDLTPTGSVRVAAKGDPTILPGYDEGVWWVQD
ncbi:MAG: MFS transporter, partial [Rhodobacteraceae bacterium]|nr:MFS transporter [Paracoccaceae bacterium]